MIETARQRRMMRALYVHGGVSGVARSTSPSLAHAVEAAAAAPSSIDAVELSVRALEDDPELNAGFGAALNREGAVELDAGIASAGRGAGVANVRLRHPISLARIVFERTPHGLITGRGAEELARRHGLERLEDTSEQQRERWLRARDDGSLDLDRYGSEEHVDTVGSVALDDRGVLSAGSSTGGVFGQMPGRVGDSPIFGAGTFASARAAVVGTGVGELFLETLACLGTARLIEEGRHPMDACEHMIDRLGAIDGAPAGILALDSEGRMGAVFRGGSWAVEGLQGPMAPHIG